MWAAIEPGDLAESFRQKCPVALRGIHLHVVPGGQEFTLQREAVSVHHMAENVVDGPEEIILEKPETAQGDG
jgi:hypothetical protein